MIPSAAPYSVTWNAERQVTTESPLIERAFFRLQHCAAIHLQPRVLSTHLSTLFQ
jgi:hypothetical protein